VKGAAMAKGIQNRRTPLWFFHAIEDFFQIKFKLDAAACKRDALCKKFYTKRDNGLIKPWVNWTFCNPEFKDTTAWVHKAWREATVDKRHSILLAPTGCSQGWLHGSARDFTIFVPDCRISYNLPNGKPDPGADRDTMVLGFGPRFINKGSELSFNMCALPVKHARIAG
jgi:phage N-6-adenine-methyltransferase